MESRGIGISHLPNQRYKTFCKRGLNYNIMVAGPRGSGKTSFINMLLRTKLMENEADYSDSALNESKIRSVSFRSSTAPYEMINKENQSATKTENLSESLINMQICEGVFLDKKFNVRLGVTEIDGIGDQINNDKCWEPIIAHINDQFVDFYKQESEHVRAIIKDKRIHVCLYFIESYGEPIKPIDVRVMKELSKYCNLIPVVSKSDILNDDEMNYYYDAIVTKLEQESISIFEPRNLEKMENEAVRPPYFVISGSYGEDSKILIRKSLWGTIEIESQDNNDFNELRKVLVEDSMIELIETTEAFYESFRTKELTKDLTNDAKLSEAEVRLSKEFLERLRTEERNIAQAKNEYLKKKTDYEMKLKEKEAEIITVEQQVQ